MERDAIDFGTEKVSTLFKKLFFPTLLGMLGMSAMTAIDGIFIGHSVGSDGIAAVNIICPPLMLLTGLGLMTGTGCSVVASIHLSRGKTKAARLNVTQAFLFATAAAAVPVALLLGFTDEAARLLGSSEHLLPLVRDYIVWNVPSWVFMVWEAVALAEPGEPCGHAVRVHGAAGVLGKHKTLILVVLPLQQDPDPFPDIRIVFNDQDICRTHGLDRPPVMSLLPHRRGAYFLSFGLLPVLPAALGVEIRRGAAGTVLPAPRPCMENRTAVLSSL